MVLSARQDCCRCPLAGANIYIGDPTALNLASNENPDLSAESNWQLCATVRAICILFVQQAQRTQSQCLHLRCCMDTAKELQVSEVVCCIVSVFKSVQHTLGVCKLYSTDECRLVQQVSSVVIANGHDNSYV